MSPFEKLIQNIRDEEATEIIINMFKIGWPLEKIQLATNRSLEFINDIVEKVSQ